jgi:hypothetical protein
MPVENHLICESWLSIAVIFERNLDLGYPMYGRMGVFEPDAASG